MKHLTYMLQRIRKYFKNTQYTEIIPLPYAVAIVVISMIALTLFIKPDHAMSGKSNDLDLQSIAQTVNPLNPLAFESLYLDQHSSEEWIPQVPKLPQGITLDPNHYDILNDPARTTPAPEPVASVKIKPTEVTTTTIQPLPEGRCSQWYPTALEAGWSEDQLTKLGNIIFKESSCIHDIANKTYSYGLVQIEWSAHNHWLESEFGITERTDLFDPYTNLLVGKWLYDYAQKAYGCGWQPWYMSGDWC